MHRLGAVCKIYNAKTLKAHAYIFIIVFTHAVRAAVRNFFTHAAFSLSAMFVVKPQMPHIYFCSSFK